MSKYKQLGEDVWKNKVDKINSEIFILTYGSVVVQLIKDYENIQEVNKQLEKMGYNIGIRLIEDYLSKTSLTKCGDLKETAENLSKVGFKMFMNVTPQVSLWNEDNTSFSLIFEDNPLGDYVDLPLDVKSELWYSNVLCGVIRGALEMVQIQVEAFFEKDTLRGDDTTQIRVRFIKYLSEEVPNPDD